MGFELTYRYFLHNALLPCLLLLRSSSSPLVLHS